MWHLGRADPVARRRLTMYEQLGMRELSVAAVAVVAGCHAAPASAPDAGATADAMSIVDAADAGPPPTPVPHTTQTIKIDGDWDESDWRDVALQFVFTANDGEQARPYSEVRFLYDDTNLYIGAYAADEDIESSDFFQFSLGVIDFQIDPYGHVTASAPGITAAAEYDGTINDPSDYDEEWLLEAAVPLALAGLDQGHPSPMRASRCDTPKDGELHCGAAAATLIATGSLSR